MPLLFFAAAGALFAGGTGGGWYFWKRGQQEAAKRLQQADAEAAKQALKDAIDVVDLRKQAETAGMDPDEVIVGYERLRDAQVSPESVLEAVKAASITASAN